MEKTKLEEFKEILKNAGIVGAGGAGFPMYAKLSDKADTVIMNCAECEPLLKLHRQLLYEYTDEILDAFDKVVEAVGAERGIIAVKSIYKETVKALESEINNHKKLSIFKLKSVYPMGDELILIKEVTGRSVKPGALPITVGCIVNNVETIYNAGKALKGEPVTEKYVTVAGEVKNPLTFKVPIGTKISELVKFAGGVTVDNPAYISGGPMMGKIVNANDAVTKTTNAILVLPENHCVVLSKYRNPKTALKRAMSVCCQCHSCTDLCSRHVAGYPVEPHMVMRILANGGKGDVNAIKGAVFCSGCGLCENYSCPMGLSPKMLIDEMKAVARQNGIKPPKDMEISEVKDAEYKRVSVERLTSRLALKKYDKEAPTVDGFKTNKVKIMLSQHIGAPAEPCVQVGDEVKKGDKIANAKENALSVNIHSSLDGKVTAITEKYIKIEA